jgi:YidC/Oxa1 family membrane protein insertase
MKFTGESTLKEGKNELVLNFESADVGGLKLVKTYTLTRGSYAIKVNHQVLNTGNAAVSPQLYVQLVRDGNKPEGESAFYSTFTGPAVYTEAKKYQKIEFTDIEKGKAEFEKNAPQGYVAMVQHYFASAWVLPANTVRENFARKVDTNLYSVGMITPFSEVAPGQTKALEATLFVGPQEEKNVGSAGTRFRAGQRLWLAHGLGQTFVLVARSLVWLPAKLGLGHCGFGLLAQVGFLLAQCQSLRQHGQDEGHQSENHGNA